MILNHAKRSRGDLPNSDKIQKVSMLNNREAKRNPERMLVIISMKTACRLEKIKADRSSQSIQEVIMILLDR